MRVRLASVACGWLWLAGPAIAGPLLQGVDHVPVVVSELEKAKADYNALGFALKPGRPHDNGIRNAHVKFPDGTEIELITAPKAVDALTTEYRAQLKGGEGPVYFGIYSPDRTTLAVRLRELGEKPDGGDMLGFSAASSLHPLFFAGRQKSPTDRNEHFAHENGALRLAGFWIAGGRPERRLLAKLGTLPRLGRACSPFGDSAQTISLPEGELRFLPGREPAHILAVTVLVRNMALTRQVLLLHGVRPATPCGPAALWIPPALAHGIWIQFVPA